MPAPSIASKFAVQERDVKRPRRAGKAKYDISRAEQIRKFFGIPSSQEVADPIRMSDNEILDYMQEGFTATEAVEFKRWDITPEVAGKSVIGRLPIKETVRRMRDLDLSPDEATRIIRNGMTDRLLDKHLTDNELFGLLHEEKLHSPKYQDRANGVAKLVEGICTREDYHGLSLEQMGKYGGYLNVKRQRGEAIDYDVIRRMIDHTEQPHIGIPSLRYHEGWTAVDSALSFHSLNSLVTKYGPEIMDLKYIGVIRMSYRFGETMEAYQYMSEFFDVAGNTPMALSSEQRKDMQSWDNKGYSVADLTGRLKQEGLSPDQAFNAITNGMTVDKAKEVHLNKQSASMIEGWL